MIAVFVACRDDLTAVLLKVSSCSLITYVAVAIRSGGRPVRQLLKPGA